MGQEKNRLLIEESAVLITGGSGYVGSHLIKKLAKRKSPIVCMYRHKLPEPNENVFPVCSDLSSEDLLAAPLRGVKTVVHLAWERGILPSSYNMKELEKLYDAKKVSINIRNLQNLVQAMEKAKTNKIIFISALGAGLKTENPFLREKYWAENIILNSKIKEKIILQPPLLFGGQSQHNLETLCARIFSLPLFAILPKGSKTLTPLYVEDFSDIIVDFIEKDFGAKNGIIPTYNKEEKLEVKEICLALAKEKNKVVLAVLQGKFAETLLRFFDKITQREDANILKTLLNLTNNTLACNANLAPKYENFFRKKFTSFISYMSKKEKLELGEPAHSKHIL